MPSFSTDDIDIEPSDFIDSCSRREISELIDCLIEDGYIKPNSIVTNNKNAMSANEDIFEDHLNSLHGKYVMLTQEEEELITKIAKRFL